MASEVPRDQEVSHWNKLLGTFVDKFTTGEEVDVPGLCAYVHTRLGEVFGDQNLTDALESLAAITVETSVNVRSQIAERLTDLRTESGEPYPKFEGRLRESILVQNGFTALDEQNMVSYEVGDHGYVYIHIQPSYSVPNKVEVIQGAMRTLARDLNSGLIEASHIAFAGWPVEKFGRILHGFGFTIASSKSSFAYMDAESFKQRWLH